MTPHDSPVQNRSGLDARLAAAGQDPDQILHALNAELALRRAGRKIKGSHQAHAMRALSVAMLFLLILGTCGALLYLQTQLGGHPAKQHRVTNPVPDPSAPGVDPGRQSAPPTR